MDAKQQGIALLDILERLRGVHGVQVVSSAESNVLGRAWTHNLMLPGSGRESLEATMVPISTQFFDTMHIPLRSGRVFVPADMDPASATTIIVNETFATRYFSGAAAVGQSIETRFGGNEDGGRHEIVGVVADARYDLRKPAAPTIYIPLTLRSTGTIYVRVSGDPAPLASRLREEVHAAESAVPCDIRHVAGGARRFEHSIRERLLALLAGFFGLVGLVLAAVGLHGVLSYSVVQRTREIGIRMALGARQQRLVRTVLAEAGSAALVGAVFGMAAGALSCALRRGAALRGHAAGFLEPGVAACDTVAGSAAGGRASCSASSACQSSDCPSIRMSPAANSRLHKEMTS